MLTVHPQVIIQSHWQRFKVTSAYIDGCRSQKSESNNCFLKKKHQHQVKCGALRAQLWYRFIKEGELIRTIKWTLSDSGQDKRRINVGICQQSTLCVPFKSNWAGFDWWQFNSCWGFKVSNIVLISASKWDDATWCKILEFTSHRVQKFNCETEKFPPTRRN